MLRITLLALLLSVAWSEIDPKGGFIKENPVEIVKAVFGDQADSLPVGHNCQAAITKASITCVGLVDAKWNKSVAMKNLTDSNKNNDSVKVKEIETQIGCCALFDNEDCIEPRVKLGCLLTDALKLHEVSVDALKKPMEECGKLNVGFHASKCHTLGMSAH